jgi:plastocyanin
MLRAIAWGAGGSLLSGSVGSALAANDDIDSPDTPDTPDTPDDDQIAIVGQIPEGAVRVLIDDDDADGFQPGNLTVDVGQTVTFINADDDPHTATGSGFDTGIIQPGDTATIVLDTPGTFAYACLIHPIMTGRIAVRDEAGRIPPPAKSVAPEGAMSVRIIDLSFDPPAIAVPAGTTVSWDNEDTVPHTVTAVDGSFDSGIFDPGGVFSWEFTSPGVFEYLCNLHPQMRGSVEVTGEAVTTGGHADMATPAAGSISGSWAVLVTPGTSHGLPPMRLLVTYRDDGTLDATVTIDGDGEIAPGVVPGPAQGTWVDEGAGRVRALLVLFLMDGEMRYAGTLIIREDIELAAAASSYTGAAAIDVAGPSGETIVSASAVSQGERVDAVPDAVTTPAAPVGSPVSPVASPAGSGMTAVVEIRDFTFDPSEIEIPVGGAVHWINAGEAPHTATADDGAFDSGVLDPGQEWSQAFDQAGEFPYFCAIHQAMTGSVIVR